MAEADSLLRPYRRRMEGTLRLIGWLERHAGALGTAGALLLVAYWNQLARDLILPGGVWALLHLATTALLVAGVMGHQLSQGTHPSSWVGWSGTAAVGLGFGGSLILICAGLVLLGISHRCAAECSAVRAGPAVGRRRPAHAGDRLRARVRQRQLGADDHSVAAPHERRPRADRRAMADLGLAEWQQRHTAAA